MMMTGGNSQAAVEASGRFTISDVSPGQLPRHRGVPGDAGMAARRAGSCRCGHRRRRGRARHAARGEGTGRSLAWPSRDRSDHRALGHRRRREGKAGDGTHAAAVSRRSRSTGSSQSRRIRTTRAGEDGRYVVPPRAARRLSADDAGRSGARVVVRQGGAQRSRIVVRQVSLAEGEKRMEHVRIR